MQPLPPPPGGAKGEEEGQKPQGKNEAMCAHKHHSLKAKRANRLEPKWPGRPLTPVLPDSTLSHTTGRKPYVP